MTGLDAPFAAAPFGGWPPDPLLFPGPYIGVTWRRWVAYCIDFWIIFLVLVAIHSALFAVTILSFGLLWPLHLLVVPIAIALLYHILQMASPAAATFGMRLFGLRAWRMDGGRPSLAQAIIHTLCLYLTLGFSGGILMLVALFNARRRTIHDFLADIVIVRDR
jgi:uncharacterized RDD family membrane protein YckC